MIRQVYRGTRYSAKLTVTPEAASIAIRSASTLDLKESRTVQCVECFTRGCNKLERRETGSESRVSQFTTQETLNRSQIGAEIVATLTLP